MQFTKTIPLKPRKSNWKWLSIAAAVVLMFSVYSVNYLDNIIITDKERHDAELAYAETQKAFQLISQNLNKGGNVAMAGLQEFGNAQNKIFKTTKK